LCGGVFHTARKVHFSHNLLNSEVPDVLRETGPKIPLKATDKGGGASTARKSTLFVKGCAKTHWPLRSLWVGWGVLRGGWGGGGWGGGGLRAGG